jgi:SAM-dependent methyltransferase
MLPFKLPPPPNAASFPEWIENGFRLGQQVVPVLEYSENFAGWSDDLTTLHEEAAGEAHPIDVASRQDALRQLQSHLSTKTPCILEIGCSSGFMLKAMKQALPGAVIVGADVVREPLYKLARELPTVPLLRLDLLQCPLPSSSFDAVVMLNVLEHIQDDDAALAQVYRLLKPGGIAIIEVPAGPRLYDAYDKALKHFRRYDIGELTAKLLKVGFSVERQSHLGFFLYPAFAIVKRRNQRQTNGEVGRNALVRMQASSTSSSRLFRLAIAIETALGKWLSFPNGIRCLARVRKPG